MRIQHNIMAMNAYRNYTNNTNALSANLEKLSSGYKINRAGDDAAGLAISEKMRAQITGLEQAQDNAKSGKNLVNTAEGALQEVHDMLNRMVKLADQSANGTYDNETDRAALQDEVNQLTDEIDRIADSANYNGIKLLNGDLHDGSSGSVRVPTLSGLDLTDNAAVADSATLGKLTAVTSALSEGDKLNLTINYTDASGKKQSVTLTAYYSESTAGAATNGSLFDKDGNKLVDIAGTKGQPSQTELATAFEKLAKESLGDSFKVTNASGDLGFESKVKGANMKIDSVLADWAAAGANQTPSSVAVTHGTAGADAFKSIDFATNYNMGDVFTIGGKKFAFVTSQDDAVALGKDVNAVVVANNTSIAQADVEDMADLIEQKTGYKPTVNTTTMQFKAPDGLTSAGNGLTLQIGDTSDEFNQLTISIQDMHADTLGIGSISVADQKSAQEAVDVIKAAINTVSSVRGTLGAASNRLDHTMNNLSVMTENIQDAESTIRDTDVAEEMMAYTKNNILVQSAQAMLAQANQVPQGVLQLLQ
jgi:flagellin